MFSISSQKGVLYLTDDVLCIYEVSGRSVLLKEMFDWEHADILEKLTLFLKGNFSSIIVLNDTVDQHYRKEKVPNVGILDMASVVKRRLRMAFPEFQIRAFKRLEDEENLSKGGGRSMGHYLFYACPDNNNMRVVINAIRDSGVGFQGVSLLPMESEGLVTALVEAFLRKKSKKNKKKDSGWYIFLGQNVSGGLRQIVVKNGSLALTRISPIVETDADISLWCNEVKRELNSTMEYLSRFGYRSEDPLSVVVIANNKALPIFEDIIDLDVSINVVSVAQASKMLGLSPVKNELEHVANVLHVGWVAKKARLSAPMKSAVLNSIIKYRSMATAMAMMLVLVLAGSVYLFTESFISLNHYQKNINLVKRQKREVHAVYNKEVERKEALGIDVKLMQASFGVQSELEKELLDPLEIVESVGRAMRGIIKLDSISIERQERSVDQFSSSLEVESGIVPSETVLKFSFPGTVDIEKGNNAVIAFSDRLRKELKGAKITVTKILKDVSYKGDLKSEVGILAQEKTSDVLEAEIIVKYGGQI